MRGMEFNDIVRALVATNTELTPDITAAIEELDAAAYKLGEAVKDYGNAYINAKLSFFEPEDDDDPQPAPVETSHQVKEGDRVRVVKADTPEDKPYIGQVGRIFYDHSTDGGIEVFPYEVSFDADLTPRRFSADALELEPAD